MKENQRGNFQKMFAVENLKISQKRLHALI